MTQYESTTDVASAAAMIRDTDGPFTVITHGKPDGDAFGSVVALTAALRMLGREVTACFVPPVPAPFNELRGRDLVQVYEEGYQLPDGALNLILDTGAWTQIGPFKDTFADRLDRTLIIDHHLSGDIPARHRVIDGAAAACCEVVAVLIDQLFDGLRRDGGELDRTIREALFVGIASDTGWFRFSNTRPETHELAARLLREGVNHADLYQQLEQNERPQKLALLIRALDSLKLLADGHAAVMVLRRSDFAETGALEEETERLIDIPQQIGTIQVIVLISERKGGNGDGEGPVTRISFRSKPGPNAINVAELAAQFGGGGHARAAGCTIHAPLQEVLPHIEKALEAAVAGRG